MIACLSYFFHMTLGSVKNCRRHLHNQAGEISSGVDKIIIKQGKILTSAEPILPISSGIVPLPIISLKFYEDISSNIKVFHKN